MSDLSEVTKLIEASNQSFETFQISIKARLDSLENKNARTNRPNFGNGEIKSMDSPEVKAFDRYLRTGDSTEIKSLSIGSGPDGGFAVPRVIDGLIESVALKYSPIRQYATVQKISTSDFHKLVNKRGWGASWVGETDARPATTSAQLADIAPPMGDLYANPQATQYMLDDVQFNASEWIAQEIGMAFGQAEADSFINGSGVNQPKGFLAGPAPVATGDTTRTFGTLEYVASGAAGDWTAGTTSSSPADTLLKAIFKTKVGYRDGAAWFMHPTLLQDIMTFKDQNGRYVYTPSIASGAPGMLWGYPVVECEAMPTKAANSLSIAFGNMQRAYLIVDRMGIRVLIDQLTNKPYTGFYTTARIGGALVNSEALKIIKFAAS